MSAPPSSAADLATAATEATDASRAHLADSHPPLDLHELPPAPTTIDRFRILTALGSGGMGVVYEAHDPKLDRYVAIKLVHRRLSEREGTRLHREAQSLARLSHPNVVQVFEVGRCPHGMYLVMELVRGQPLRQWLGARTREPAEILAVFLQAGEGLAAAHAAGLVHRDFKPANVLVGDDGRARVLDFGLARVGRATSTTGDGELGDPPSISGSHAPLDDQATLPATSSTKPAPASLEPLPLDPDSLGEDLVAAPLTDHGSVLGTPAYMAPEQHLGQPLTAAADQFGFCVALYEALYRTHPFGTPEDRIRRVLLGVVRPPPPLTTTTPVPEHVRTAILRGLSPNPRDRFSSMQALLHALRPPTRRSRLAIGTALLLGTAALAATIWAATPRPDPCTAGTERLAPAWDDQRDAARTGMLATALPYAAETWEHTEARLVEYADTWLAAHAHACEAGVQGTLASVELDGRMRCLDERREALGALVGELASADAFTVQHALEAVGQLPPIDDCESTEYLRGTLPPPPPESATEVQRLHERLATLHALYLTGRHAEGLVRATELRPAIDALGYPPLMAELELREGMLHIRAGDPPAAREHLEAAYFLAKELAHDRVALEAALNLVFVTSTLQHDLEAAQAWIDHAAAELPLAGTPSLRASYEGLRGVLAGQAQRFEEAAEHHQRAAALHEAARGPSDPMVARSLANYGLALAWLGRFDEATASLQRAIAILEARLGPRHPDVALHLNNLGIVLYNHGDPGAREQLERALEIRRQILEPDHLDIANTLEQLGRVHVGASRFDEARPLLERALEIRRRKQGPEHIQLAFALGGLGELQLRRDEAKAAERSFREAKEMAEAVAPEHAFVPYAQSWLGESLLAQARSAEGAAELREALSRMEAARGSEHDELMGPLQSLAGVALDEGRPAEALPLAERALALGERAALPESRLAIARWLVSQALWNSGVDRARARSLAEQAVVAWQIETNDAERLAEAEQWLAEHPMPSAPPAPLP